VDASSTLGITTTAVTVVITTLTIVNRQDGGQASDELA
jgi:hypothetical protein